MIKTKNDTSLINYSHDREAHYKVTADEIYNLINDFTDSEELKIFYRYFEKNYKLPINVVKQTTRQYIARSYLFKSGKFNYKLHLKSIPKSITKYCALFYALIFAKFNINKIKKYKF